MRNRPPLSRTPLRRWAGAGVNLVLVAMTLFAVAFIAPTLIGYERYVITGGSMSGTIEKGSIVFERSVPVDDLEVGDVITYLPPASSGVHTLVTHRIVEITDPDGELTFRTQGDANADPDPWTFSLVDAEQPVVEATVPYVGYAIIALADRETRMWIIGLPAGLIAVAALFELIRAIVPTRRPTSDLPTADVPNCGDLVELPSPASGAMIRSVELDADRIPAHAGHH